MSTGPETVPPGRSSSMPTRCVTVAVLRPAFSTMHLLCGNARARKSTISLLVGMMRIQILRYARTNMSQIKSGAFLAACVWTLSAWTAVPAATGTADKKPDGDDEKAEGGKFQPFKSESKVSSGSVTVGGQSISYQAIAGSLIVHPKDWDDVPRDPKSDKENSMPGDGESKNPTAEASMFYVAYFKSGGNARPVTFLYNGGPG